MYKKIKKFFSFKREIIVIFNHSIYSKKIGFSFLIYNITFVLWSAYSTVVFFQMQRKYVEQEEKMSFLENKEQSFLSRISILNREVDKISTYVATLNKYDRFLDNVKYDDYRIEADVDEKYIPLIEIRNKIYEINYSLSSRIEKFKNIERKILLGRNNINLIAYNKLYEPEMENLIDPNIIKSLVFKRRLDNNVDSVIAMEEQFNRMPLSKTINFVRVSSPFGVRIDPIHNNYKTHLGIDLVGPYLSKIYAPADGKVIFVGTKGGYGNLVILEHENGIKTLYGHLSSFSVSNNDFVRRGQVIGVQGSTGKTTGDHLHYEIIGSKNERYNPKDLVDFGEKLF